MTLSGQRAPQRRKKEGLRNAILDAARHTMLREGFDAVSMRKIADAIGYSPASLYLHFENRDAIAEALCTEGHAQLIQALHGVPNPDDNALRTFAFAYLEFARTHEAVYRLMFMDGAALTRSALDGGHETVVSVLTPLVGDDHHVANYLWATLHGIASLSMNQALSAPANELVEHAITPYL
jgi:AcrR family transcriptional regulator